jgi:hypothetical protein
MNPDAASPFGRVVRTRVILENTLKYSIRGQRNLLSTPRFSGYSGEFLSEDILLVSICLTQCSARH